MRRLAALFALSLALAGCASLHRVESGDMSPAMGRALAGTLPK